MRGYNNWSFKPYIPYDKKSTGPYICRLEPGEDYICGEWFDLRDHGEHILHYFESGKDEVKSFHLSNNGFTIKNLKPDTEYGIFIQGKDRSNIRLARTGYVPGKVVSYLHYMDTQYDFSGHSLCSPSILRLPNGSLLASNDYYKAKSPQNLTSIFRSDNNGKSWYYVTDLYPCFWGKLFYHKDSVYMLATANEYGDLLIGKSDDEGRTWTTPTVILRGSNSCFESGFHKAPNNIVRAYGRLWTSIDYGSWVRKSFSNSIFSIDENADLLQAENWCCTGFLKHDPHWENAEDIPGAIEGNIVVAPDGSIVNMLRYCKNKALMLIIDSDKPEELPRFHRIIDFPLGHSKFEIIQKGSKYYAVGNRLPLRTILSLYVSEDLYNWDFVMELINYEELPPSKVGFQYPSAFIENDILYVLLRTGFNHAYNYHDANYITFHKYNV